MAALRGRPAAGDAGETAPPAASRQVPLFIAVGALLPKKGFRYLIEAVRLLKDREVPVEVSIVGGGPDRELLSQMIRELEVEDRVRLEGPMGQDRLLPSLRAADAFVLPCVLADDGDKDGIPVAIMEAMAFRIPCISTAISGIPELIESGKEGLLVPQKNPAALADAMERLARNPALRVEYGRAARRKVEAAFTLEGEARELDRLIRR
jgi:glycosyltransferase involved in cell wall biosynthesis